MENNSNNKNGTSKNRRRPHHRGNKHNKNHNANSAVAVKQQSVAEDNIVETVKETTEEIGNFSDNEFIYFSGAKEKEKNEEKYTFTQEYLDSILKEREPIQDDRPKTEIIGIRFKKVGKMYYFSPNGIVGKKGVHAIVETARGLEFGEIVVTNSMVHESEFVPPLRPVVRLATEADIKHHDENKVKQDEAFKICNEKIIAHGLDMKLIDAQYTFDNSKLLFYFTSSGRVDFRELVKDLASVFKTRIELRQIGIRDEAKLIGGLGICGRPLCCSVFLSDFGQVSIKMAKEQNLSLNSSKISGACGRLMCCLRYEHETYTQEIKKTPPVDSRVKTPDGIGTVTEISPLAAKVKVRLDDKPDQAPRSFSRNDVTVIPKERQ